MGLRSVRSTRVSFDHAVAVFKYKGRQVRDVYEVQGLRGVVRRTRGWVRKRRSGTAGASRLPLGPLPEPVRWHPHVLSVAERSLPQCYHYRVQQKREICEHLGIPFDDVAIDDLDEALTRLQLASVLIVYRLPGNPALDALVAQAQRLHIPVVYEVDDMVYRREVTAANPNLDTLPRDLAAAVIRSSDGYLRALRTGQFNLASTQPLADDMATVNYKPAFVVENGIDAMMIEIAQGLALQPVAPQQDEGLIVTYGSGSRAHDHDFQLAAPALAKWLAATPAGRVKVLGPVRIPEELQPFESRILRRTDVLAYGEYLRELASSSISLAPLTDDPFNAFKSQVKYLESALVGVPLIASPTVYSNYIEDGRTGFIAADEQQWLSALTLLSTDAAVRARVAAAAREHVKQWELTRRPSEQMAALVSSLSPATRSDAR